MARDDASALTDEDSSYGPVPPPPSVPPPTPEDVDAAHDEESAYESQPDDVHIENMPSKDDPPQEFPDGTPIPDDYEEDQSVEIPPTQVVQRMIKEEQHQAEKDDGNIMYIGGAIACCLVVVAVVLGAGFGTGAFTKDDDPVQKSIPNPDATEPPEDTPVATPVTPAPTQLEIKDQSAYKTLISDASYNADALDSNESPESLALNWIISEDPLKLDPESPSDQFRIQQRYALLSQGFASDGWTDQSGWFDEQVENECEWFGVTCEEQDLGGEVGVQNVVVAFEMEDNRFGAVTPDIAMLSRVTTLNLANNPLSGQTLPASVLSMTELENLFLDDSGMTGDVSDFDWSGMTNLKILSFAGNAFTGTLNDSFYSMTSLKEVYLNDGNKISGELSPLVGNFVDLEVFDVNSNLMTGPLPPEFGQLALLRVLDLGHIPIAGSTAGFTSTIPDEYGNFASLTELNLESNKLTGDINPAFAGLSLTIFRVGNNNFNQGSIPDFVYTMTSLEDVGLDDCRLIGSIPPIISNLVNLRVLSLDANSLTGALPTNLGQLVSLTRFTAFDNSFGGGLPSELTNLVNLEVLDISDSELTGNIPASIADMTSLVELRLSGNSLTGQIPSSITSIISLEEIELTDNALSGLLPFAMGSLFELRIFRVNDNTRSGVEGSGISGKIPSSMGNLPFLEEIELQNNLMTGQLPTEMGKLESLRYLDIEFNGFNGTVPEEFSNCLALEEFYLSNNNFDQGDLPESLCEIGGLTDLVTDCGLQNSCSRCVRPAEPEGTTAPEASG